MRNGVAALVVLAALGGLAAPAEAAELIGSPLTGNATNLLCGGCDASAVQIAGPTSADSRCPQRTTA